MQEHSRVIRRAGVQDIEALAPLFDAYRQFYGKTTDLELARGFLRERLERTESAVFLAELDGRPAGFTQLYPSFSSASAARIWILNDLYVAGAARRHGLATALLHAAADFARAAGAVRLSLSTGIANTSAQALYEAQGWIKDQSYYVYNLALKR
jgi:GNAT superfamily N-acetyltransferase